MVHSFIHAFMMLRCKRYVHFTTNKSTHKKEDDRCTCLRGGAENTYNPTIQDYEKESNDSNIRIRQVDSQSATGPLKPGEHAFMMVILHTMGPAVEPAIGPAVGSAIGTAVGSAMGPAVEPAIGPAVGSAAGARQAPPLLRHPPRAQD
jgi:hypothetical protein